MCGGPALSVQDESVATVTSERCRYEVYIFDENKLSQEIAVQVEYNKCSGVMPAADAVYSLISYLA